MKTAVSQPRYKSRFSSLFNNTSGIKRYQSITSFLCSIGLFTIFIKKQTTEALESAPMVVPLKNTFKQNEYRIFPFRLAAGFLKPTAPYTGLIRQKFTFLLRQCNPKPPCTSR